jgi:hypothetical protein
VIKELEIEIEDLREQIKDLKKKLDECKSKEARRSPKRLVSKKF